MLAEGLRGHWNSDKSTIPTFAPASSTGSTREVSPSVYKGMPLAVHHCPVLRSGVGVSLKFNSSPCLGPETDPRRSPVSTVAATTATAAAANAVRLLTSSDPHYTHTHNDASVVVEDVSALLIPKKNSPYYGYSTVGHGFQYPPVREDRTPTGTFTGLKSTNSANLNDLRASYEDTEEEESTPSVSLSTPLLDNISFSPFLNFTPESDIRPSESRLMFGEREKLGMKPYGMSTVPMTRHAVHEDIFSYTRTADPNAAESSSVSLTLPNTMESNIGWLDDAFLYDLVAE